MTALLTISGDYRKGLKRPIEMTIVVKSEIIPWHYPPTFDFQYGDWLRTKFESGDIEPWPTKEMPDLALLITQILLASKVLWGPNPEQLLSRVPKHDILRATAAGIDSLMPELHTDTRNVLLTLARIWSRLNTNQICHSKLDAADWAIHRLPKNYQPVMARARAIYIDAENERWDDIRALVQSCANFMLSEINHLLKHSKNNSEPL